MKIMCVLIPHFLYKATILRQHNLIGRRILLINTEGSVKTVLSWSPNISGLHIGMPLQKALNITKEIIPIEIDKSYYKEIHNKILKNLTYISPIVEDSGFGHFYIGLGNISRIDMGEQKVTNEIQSNIPKELYPQIGIGEGKFISYLAALSAPPGKSLKAPEDLKVFLNQFSVDVLPIKYEIKAKLHEFGLHKLRDITKLTVTSLQSQFGFKGKFLWELSNGIDNRYINSIKIEEIIIEKLIFDEPINSWASIFLSIHVLIKRAFLSSNLNGRYIRPIDIEGKLLGGRIWNKRISLKKPVANEILAITRIKETLDGIILPGELEDLTIRLSGLTKEPRHQLSLFRDIRRKENLKQYISQMKATLKNPSPIYHVRAVEPWSRIPERRYALVQYIF